MSPAQTLKLESAKKVLLGYPASHPVAVAACQLLEIAAQLDTAPPENPSLAMETAHKALDAAWPEGVRTPREGLISRIQKIVRLAAEAEQEKHLAEGWRQIYRHVSQDGRHKAEFFRTPGSTDACRVKTYLDRLLTPSGGKSELEEKLRPFGYPEQANGKSPSEYLDEVLLSYVMEKGALRELRDQRKDEREKLLLERFRDKRLDFSPDRRGESLKILSEVLASLGFGLYATTEATPTDFSFHVCTLL
jgi:hypothetical protein